MNETGWFDDQIVVSNTQNIVIDMFTPTENYYRLQDMGKTLAALFSLLRSKNLVRGTLSPQ